MISTTVIPKIIFIFEHDQSNNYHINNKHTIIQNFRIILADRKYFRESLVKNKL